MAAAPIIPDALVCFAELIVRLDSLLTLREDRVAVEEGQEQDDKIHAELESDIKLKLNELHLRLKNGGAVQDRSIGDDVDEEDEAVDDSQFSSANELVKALELEFRRDERVMRYLTVKLDKHALAWAEKRIKRDKSKS